MRLVRISNLTVRRTVGIDVSEPNITIRIFRASGFRVIINPGHVIHSAQMCVCYLLTAVLGSTLSPRMVGTSARVRVWRTTRPLLVFLLLCSLPRSLSLPRSTAAASAQRWTLPQSSVNRRDQTRSNLRIGNRPRRSARSVSPGYYVHSSCAAGEQPQSYLFFVNILFERERKPTG